MKLCIPDCLLQDYKTQDFHSCEGLQFHSYFDLILTSVNYNTIRIEDNPVWREVNSHEFDSQFLHHEILAVVNITTLVTQAHTLSRMPSADPVV